VFTFQCNVCGSAQTLASKDELERENPTCDTCGSTVRFRWIVHALSTELFGCSICLTDFPMAQKVVGIGMSEWNRITDLLEERLSFKNTFYHTEPKFDILLTDLQSKPIYDFIISSEVFEHVPPPVQFALLFSSLLIICHDYYILTAL
jgi:hypothetical protein